MQQQDTGVGFLQGVREELAAAGLADAELLSSSPESAAFGDTAAVFRLGVLLLRFVHDRGEDFMDLASGDDPSRFHQFDDVEIAFGWTTQADVLGKRGPEPLAAVLSRLRRNLATLESAFSPDRAPASWRRVEEAARQRGAAFSQRLGAAETHGQS